MHDFQYNLRQPLQNDEVLKGLFQDHLRDLAHYFQIPALVPNEFNVCSLSLDDDHYIHISYSATDMQMHWTSSMASVAFKDTSTFFSTLLTINLNSSLTQGGFFALDEMTDIVIYRQRESIHNLTAEHFIAVTERFIERTHFWRKSLQSAISQLPEKC
jgi:hypothetical protein